MWLWSNITPGKAIVLSVCCQQAHVHCCSSHLMHCRMQMQRAGYVELYKLVHKLLSKLWNPENNGALSAAAPNAFLDMMQSQMYLHVLLVNMCSCSDTSSNDVYESLAIESR